jgi:hypothetical protein
MNGSTEWGESMSSLATRGLRMLLRSTMEMLVP